MGNVPAISDGETKGFIQFKWRLKILSGCITSDTKECCGNEFLSLPVGIAGISAFVPLVPHFLRK